MCDAATTPCYHFDVWRVGRLNWVCDKEAGVFYSNKPENQHGDLAIANVVTCKNIWCLKKDYKDSEYNDGYKDIMEHLCAPDVVYEAVVKSFELLRTQGRTAITYGSFRVYDVWIASTLRRLGYDGHIKPLGGATPGLPKHQWFKDKLGYEPDQWKLIKL